MCEKKFQCKKRGNPTCQKFQDTQFLNKKNCRSSTVDFLDILFVADCILCLFSIQRIEQNNEHSKNFFVVVHLWHYQLFFVDLIFISSISVVFIVLFNSRSLVFIFEGLKIKFKQTCETQIKKLMSFQVLISMLAILTNEIQRAQVVSGGHKLFTQILFTLFTRCSPIFQQLFF